MRSKNRPHHSFNNANKRQKAEKNPALKAYFDIVDERKKNNRSADETNRHLSMLAPHIINIKTTGLSDKDQRRCYTIYINMLGEIGDKTAARMCSEAATKLFPDDTKFIVTYASFFKDENKIDDTIKILDAGYRKNPSDKYLLIELGKCHELNNNTAMALVYFNRAGRIDPNDKYIQEKTQKLQLNPT